MTLVSNIEDLGGRTWILLISSGDGIFFLYNPLEKYLKFIFEGLSKVFEFKMSQSVFHGEKSGIKGYCFIFSTKVF